MKFVKFSIYFFLSSNMKMEAYFIFYLFFSDKPEQSLSGSINRGIYCRVPERWGLQQTHPGLRAATRHRVRDPTLAITTYKKI